MEFQASTEFARQLDESDRLAGFRSRFNMPGERNGLTNIYLCGNSLGLQPRNAVALVKEELEDWSTFAVEGHFRSRRPWVSYHRNATAGLAYLTGAQADEVVAMNTLTVNLHVLMATFYRPAGQRRKIIIESTAFPSDRYAMMSQLRLHGFDPANDLLEWAPRDDHKLHMEDLDTLLNANRGTVALLLLPGVQYYSGQVMDMPGLCETARAHDCIIGLDLAHAIGNVSLSLHEWSPDFAVWCHYKYVNGGPGAIGGAFVASRHHSGDDMQQLLGWWGHEEATRFRMARSFTPAAGAERWQLSNIPVLSLAPVLASLEIFQDAGMDELAEKSHRLTGFLDYLLGHELPAYAKAITPVEGRGCQLSIVVSDKVADGRQIFRALEEQNIMVDWREPNVIRAAPVPLYNSFEDVFEFVKRLKAVILAHV